MPIGDRALAWVRNYVDDVRPTLTVSPAETTLFLSADGQRLHLNTLTVLARRMVCQAGIAKPGACHLFRHAAATFMLENGADIRYIQAMLGHATIGTTQIYTHVSIANLKAAHAATHPGGQAHAAHRGKR